MGTLKFIFVLSLIGSAVGHPMYTCGEKRMVNRPYGKVELRVDCAYVQEYNLISVAEFKGDVQHGFQIDFDGKWRMRDSSFFMDGEENGTGLFWDTLGGVIGRETFRKGKYIGKQEYYWAPGRPSKVRTYNDTGKVEGPWHLWWKNGNKRGEYLSKDGLVIAGTDYFPSGKLRQRYVWEYESILKSEPETRFLEGQTWTPKGRSTGKLINGNGELTFFSEEPMVETGQYFVYRRVYKNGVRTKDETLNSAQIAKWLK